MEELERIVTAVPGPRSRELARALRAHESRNVTYLGDDFPVFWESASGALVRDVDENRYLDLTAAFGVANAGHGNPYVVTAIARQAERLAHGMGDVHPTETRVRLLEKLGGILPEGLDKIFLATTGSEAVEAALKTAMLATGKARFAAYRGAYHGLSLGALTVSGIDTFVDPFCKVLGERAILLEYPHALAGTTAEAAIASARAELARRDDVAAILIEPIQGRGGCIVPPAGYLAAVRALCDERGMLMIVDEIFTGFGRTGTRFAVEHDRIVPDILCIGKAMGNGFPISAVAARASVMDAWPMSTGEALHTSTYLGNPMACAAALATIHEHERLALPERARRMGLSLGSRLDRMRALRNVAGVRGRGMLWGIVMRDGAVAESVVKRALATGLIVLAAGPSGDTISLSPPLTIGEGQLSRAIDLLEAAVRSVE
ncbi:MAG: aspartate aminotransferase family protein [Candidatus Eremiobacteraeota bacterium]|nr:aspartate aminotransferase family protein [Candidatus Eremiobacteraeota bacterium]